MTGLINPCNNHCPSIITFASTHETTKVIVLGVKMLGKRMKIKTPLIYTQTLPVQSFSVGLIDLLE